MITGKKTIIALVAVVLVLCAGIYFALTFNKTDDETENTGESNIVTAFEKDVSLLESVEITNENGTFSRLTATFISSARQRANCLQIRFRITEIQKF